MASYLNPAPGNTAKQVVLQLDTGIALGTLTLGGSPMTVPALQDMTVDASNDLYTWAQLDASAKKSIATTSTNKISGNLVVDKDTFFGTSLAADGSATVAAQGLMGLSRNKSLVTFAIRVTNNDTTTPTTDDVWIKGQGYIAGLAPKISADQPLWTTPFTIAVVGEYATAAAA